MWDFSASIYMGWATLSFILAVLVAVVSIFEGFKPYASIPNIIIGVIMLFIAHYK